VIYGQVKKYQAQLLDQRLMSSSRKICQQQLLTNIYITTHTIILELQSTGQFV